MSDPSPWQGFDAYCATVHASADALLDDLAVLLESAGLEAKLTEGGKVRFYAQNRTFLDPKGFQLVAVKFGGSNPHPHVECYGEAAPHVAKLFRELVPYSHQPTRIDHAVDRRGAGLFDRLLEYARSLCKEHGLKLSFGGDWSNPDKGRTIYIGSRTSQVYVRIYEKGLKYAADLGEPVTDELREWVRVELEFKPQTKVARNLATMIEGAQMWGATSWTSQLAKEVLQMDSEPVTIRERRESNDERARRFMCSQYAKVLQRWYAEVGNDFEALGQAIGTLAGIEDAEH